MVLYLSAIDLGYIVGATSLGMLAGSVGYAAMYLYSIAALVIFAAFYTPTLFASRRKETGTSNDVDNNRAVTRLEQEKSPRSLP